MSHNDAYNLSISALAIGSAGAAGFLLYKLKGSGVLPRLGMASKGLIAVAVFLLSVAVLILSKTGSEHFLPPIVNRSFADESESWPPPCAKCPYCMCYKTPPVCHGSNEPCSSCCPKKISVLQWNPHYQCFTTPTPTTRPNCTKLVEGYLADINELMKFDFMNIIALEAKIRLPDGMEAINGYDQTEKCSKDTTTILYNSKVWQKVGNINKTCLDDQNPQHLDRIAIAQLFRNISSPDEEVIVVGAHFAHPPPDGSGVPKASLKNLKEFLDPYQGKNIILLADTNIDLPAYAGRRIPAGKKDQVLYDVFPPSDGWSFNQDPEGDDPTCCFQDKNPPDMVHPYDAIGCNFGLLLHTDPPEPRGRVIFENTVDVQRSIFIGTDLGRAVMSLMPSTRTNATEMHLPIAGFIEYMPQV